LAKLEPEHALQYVKDQESFLHHNLVQWVPPFCESILSNTDNEYYRALARCLLCFIEKADLKPVERAIQGVTAASQEHVLH
jgi:TorA maturation chaperone TorD